VTIVRRCDADDCSEDAQFMVGLYAEDRERLEATLDVCNTQHARLVIIAWLRDLADIDEST